MSITVHAPVEGFTGHVAGVAFADGVAEVDQLTPSQRRYFLGHSYGLGARAAVAGDPVIVHQHRAHIGSPLADASQEGTRRVTVLVDGAVVHDGPWPAAEVDEALESLAEQGQADGSEGDDGGGDASSSESAEPPARPNVREPINVWREWALQLPDADPDAVAAMTKPELQALGQTEEA